MTNPFDVGLDPNPGNSLPLDHAIAEAGVVAVSHEKWGETPCAFVTLHPGADLDERGVIDWCCDRLAHYKCPTRVVFGDLPETATGKIQKFVLRQQAQRPSGGERRREQP
jgi:fatty-acyl-CoA synthase